jgi:hypothetical protein
LSIKPGVQKLQVKGWGNIAAHNVAARKSCGGRGDKLQK